jgi:chemotaxis protein methyltransferase CheR
MATGPMATGLPETLCFRLSEFVADRLGLHFPKERWGDLVRGARAAAEECGNVAIHAYVQRLLSSTSCSPPFDVLANHLTVGETYFFREPRTLDLLEERIIPEVTGGAYPRRRLSIWSAGCATGEEPYSVAILLCRSIPDLKDWNISILATDVNSRSLEKAAEGVYGEWSFRSTPAWLRSAYFTVTSEGRWAILRATRNMVRFARVNLVADDHPGPFDCAGVFDVILCRNVLMYLTPEAARKVAHRLFTALAPGGWLIVGSAEASHVLFREFATVRFPNSTAYRKPPYQLDASPNHRQAGPDKPAGLPEPCLVLNQDPELEAAAAETYSAMPALPNLVDTAALQLAHVLADQRRLPEALACCDEAIRTDKMDAEAHYLRAVILQEQGLWDEAALSLRRAIYADSEFVLAHFALGSLALRQRKLTESRKCFENSLELLRKYQEEDVLPRADGVTVGRLRDWVRVEMDQAKGEEESQGAMGRR